MVSEQLLPYLYQRHEQKSKTLISNIFDRFKLTSNLTWFQGMLGTGPKSVSIITIWARLSLNSPVKYSKLQWLTFPRTNLPVQASTIVLSPSRMLSCTLPAVSTESRLWCVMRATCKLLITLRLHVPVTKDLPQHQGQHGVPVTPPFSLIAPKHWRSKRDNLLDLQAVMHQIRSCVTVKPGALRRTFIQTRFAHCTAKVSTKSTPSINQL
jgi:hypothetical protein